MMQAVRINLEVLCQLERSLQHLFLSGLSRDIPQDVQDRIQRRRSRIRFYMAQIPFSPQVEAHNRRKVEARLHTLEKIEIFLRLSARQHGIVPGEFQIWWISGRIRPGSKIPQWLYSTKAETGLQRLEVARICGSLATNAASFQNNARLMRLGQRHKRDAIHEMTECNLRLVLKTANKTGRSGMPMADRIQSGNMGLMRAAERFDWRRGTRFSTYSGSWISQQITRGIYESQHAIKKPAHIIEAGKRASKVRARALKQGVTLTTAEVAKQAQVDLQVLENLDLVRKNPKSIDEDVGPDSQMRLEEVIVDGELESSEQLAILEERKQKVRSAVRHLPEQMGNLCVLHFGLQPRKVGEAETKEHTLKEIARLWNVSHEYVRGLHNQAMEAPADRRAEGALRKDVKTQRRKNAEAQKRGIAMR